MSRRCDREGVVWPRPLVQGTDAHDPVEYRQRTLGWWGSATVVARIRHRQVMSHLRERPVLP